MSWPSVTDLSHRLAGQLQAEGTGAQTFHLLLFRVDHQVMHLAVNAARATRDAGHIARLFANRIERLVDDFDAGFGIEMIRLMASSVSDLAEAMSEQLSRRRRGGRARPALRPHGEPARDGCRAAPQAARQPHPRTGGHGSNRWWRGRRTRRGGPRAGRCAPTPAAAAGARTGQGHRRGAGRAAGAHGLAAHRLSVPQGLRAGTDRGRVVAARRGRR